MEFLIIGVPNQVLKIYGSSVKKQIASVLSLSLPEILDRLKMSELRANHFVEQYKLLAQVPDLAIPSSAKDLILPNQAAYLEARKRLMPRMPSFGNSEWVQAFIMRYVEKRWGEEPRLGELVAPLDEGLCQDIALRLRAIQQGLERLTSEGS
jgi:hypothetical protein